MKTAEEWCAELWCLAGKQATENLVNEIRSIQADALRSAGVMDYGIPSVGWMKGQFLNGYRDGQQDVKNHLVSDANRLEGSR